MLLCVLLAACARAWVAPPRAPRARAVAPRMGFWDEFDAVVDDFLNKRLGGGEIYYGARESKFYGEEDRTRSKQEFGKYQGKGYSDSRRIADCESRQTRTTGQSGIANTVPASSCPRSRSSQNFRTAWHSARYDVHLRPAAHLPSWEVPAPSVAT